MGTAPLRFPRVADLVVLGLVVGKAAAHANRDWPRLPRQPSATKIQLRGWPLRHKSGRKPCGTRSRIGGAGSIVSMIFIRRLA